ncbi:MAG: alpha/beta hydrolase [Pseudomonadota bacterium]
MKVLICLALVLACFFAVTAYLSKQQVKEAQLDYPPLGKFVTVSGRKLHYVEKGSGPAVILIHGASGNLRDFTFSLVDQLADRYRVIAFDRPGLGYSDRVAPAFEGVFETRAESPSDQARMMLAAAEMLGAKRPIVVGHSFGGGVALAWGLEQSDASALVLVAAASQPWPGSLGLYYRSTASMIGGAVAPLMISAYATQTQISDGIEAVFAPQAAPDGYAEHIGAPLTIRPRSFRANARQVNGLRPHFVDMAPRYQTLTIPVEILHGTADLSVPVDVHALPTAHTIPTAELTLLDGIGHMPHHNAQDEVIAAIDRAANRAGLL